jgi:hypothetical protein
MRGGVEKKIKKNPLFYKGVDVHEIVYRDFG